MTDYLYPSQFDYVPNTTPRVNLNPMTDNSFGTVKIPSTVTSYYDTGRGQPFLPIPESYYYWRAKPPQGASLTKAGASYNNLPSNVIMPGGIVNGKPFPKDMLGIRAPIYSELTGGIVENKRMGRQLGAGDPYTDSPWQDKTSGIQYYVPFIGKNIKQDINPIMVPPAAATDIWENSLSSNGYINRNRADDITFNELNHTCGGRYGIPSASLATPVKYVPMSEQLYGVSSPLPTQLPGQYPTGVPQVCGASVNGNSWNSCNYPPQINPVLEIQRRKLGYKPTTILPDYPEEVEKALMNGLNVD